MKKLVPFILFICVSLLLLSAFVHAHEPVELTVFLEPDSLTVFIPESDLSVSLNDFAFEVVIQRQRETFRLDEFDAFIALRFDNLPAPLCLRLETPNANTPLPRDCPEDRTIIERVSNADAFWYDTAGRNTRTILILGGREDLFCASGQSRCLLEYEPLEVIATATLTLTRIPPSLIPTTGATQITTTLVAPTAIMPTIGATQITTTLAPPTQTSAIPTSSTPRLTPQSDTTRVNVRTGDSVSYPIVGALLAGEEADIIGFSARSAWFQIRLPNGQIGWVVPHLVQVMGDLSNVPSVVSPPPP